jgi:hypothetical protein
MRMSIGRLLDRLAFAAARSRERPEGILARLFQLLP